MKKDREIATVSDMSDEETKKENTEEPEADDVVEFVFNDDGEEDIKATLKKIRKDLKDAQKEKQEYLTNWQRERADFQNYKKDDESRLKRAREASREQFIEEMLPVLDAYDMAFANKEAWEKVDKNWRQGVEYIHAQLLKVLNDYGVTEIAPEEGSPLDATMHEAIDTVSAEDKSKDGTVAQLVQKGYKTIERIIRPARVKVFELISQ